ncbi:hypothetical protein KKB64_00785 [Patescibacteria group bacterium]|nr:hypothetical protein [Patescibacteria group bacterium]MBU1472309.1 hypothetical protein [Patescibacteria group bacterium]MBU2460440.1 hypothetical protein [Patescibacteria group bacterium]MBU2544259.1 hypothetical protein [Patescibacteria group bacterium]
MSLKPPDPSTPVLLGCPLDLAVVDYEYKLWQKAESLLDYANVPRNAAEITANMIAPNKVSATLK